MNEKAKYCLRAARGHLDAGNHDCAWRCLLETVEAMAQEEADASKKLYVCDNCRSQNHAWCVPHHYPGGCTCALKSHPESFSASYERGNKLRDSPTTPVTEKRGNLGEFHEKYPNVDLDRILAVLQRAGILTSTWGEERERQRSLALADAVRSLLQTGATGRTWHQLWVALATYEADLVAPTPPKGGTGKSPLAKGATGEIAEFAFSRRYGVYVVAPDDTLSQIAERFKVSLIDLMDVNRIENPDLIFIGKILVIPRNV